ncbi:hypothetical protein OUZ56_022707 [Daphnia magna]|uniref:Uncharacterized protein n=1 Tax=Daphnia magna TaxID=35525 RepID=A0ABR0AX89_9CRUS|nr:hypothetical protein OUZ56_022707 [Daphnia magna]
MQDWDVKRMKESTGSGTSSDYPKIVDTMDNEALEETKEFQQTCSSLLFTLLARSTGSYYLSPFCVSPLSRAPCVSIEETNRLGGGGGGVALVGFFFPSESFESYVGRRGVLEKNVSGLKQLSIWEIRNS